MYPTFFLLKALKEALTPDTARDCKQKNKKSSSIVKTDHDYEDDRPRSWLRRRQWIPPVIISAKNIEEVLYIHSRNWKLIQYLNLCQTIYQHSILASSFSINSINMPPNSTRPNKIPPINWLASSIARPRLNEPNWIQQKRRPSDLLPCRINSFLQTRFGGEKSSSDINTMVWLCLWQIPALILSVIVAGIWFVRGRDDQICWFYHLIIWLIHQTPHP